VAVDHPYSWLEDNVIGQMIYESPDGGKTVRGRPSADHPIKLLTNGQLPMDIWYKIYGNKHVF
jgi:hypothetical protein